MVFDPGFEELWLVPVGCPSAETVWYILCDQAKAVAFWENTKKCPIIHTKISAIVIDANPDYLAETVRPWFFLLLVYYNEKKIKSKRTPQEGKIFHAHGRKDSWHENGHPAESNL